MKSHGVIGIVFVTVLLKLLHVAPTMALGLGSNDGNSDEPWVETLSWTPRAFLYHNFLSGEEADYIINAARPFLKRSTIVGGRGAFVDEVRSSYGMFLPRLMDPVLTSIEERVAHWTHLNVSHQEDVQVLRYGYMQQYKAHYDSLFRDGPRIATVLMYLSDVEEGGETAFPSESFWLDESQEHSMGPFSECAENHVAVKPRKGDALLFFSVKPSGKPDEASVHTGCPVLKGIKWTATIWIHSNPFRIDELGKIVSSLKCFFVCQWSTKLSFFPWSRHLLSATRLAFSDKIKSFVTYMTSDDAYE